MVPAPGVGSQVEPTPWFIDYRAELMRVSAWSDHSTMDVSSVYLLGLLRPDQTRPA